MGGLFSSYRKSEVRIAHSLNKEEENFVAERKKTVQESLKKLKIYFDWDEVPNIALLGSGGGQRAMVGLLGSLVELQKTGLLDSILYLSGVSGSTWCMASLYQEPDWSTKLETVKDKIIKRLNGPGVSGEDAVNKLKEYYREKGSFFSLTDVWAVMVVTAYVKEIDNRKLRDLWNQQSKDPFPIYTAIDKHSNQSTGDPWFEFTPYEAGYSLIGAFVETSSFGSKFENGCKIEGKPEMDMLYLQAICGSAIANEEWIRNSIQALENIPKYLVQIIKDLSGYSMISSIINWILQKDPTPEPKDYPVLKFLMTVALLRGTDASTLGESIIKKLNDLWPKIRECVDQWIWGTNYNFLHKMKDEAMPAVLLESETRDHIDAGPLLNSPYFSVLRKERGIDLIISLDFSDGDPFLTVKQAAETCKKLNIPFPRVNISNELSDRPKDFYVFKGQNTPTVIHIPLFNMVNCGGKIEDWRKKYTTFQGPYSAEMITDLMKVAGKNITNNRVKLVEQIRAATKAKC